jgi:hypothetical protein
MICPVCEHPQELGAECELCGMSLAHAGTAAASVAPVDGLEPTLHGAVDFLPELVPDLEPTHHAPAGVVALLAAVEVEPTRIAPVDVEDASPVPDLERTEAEGLPGDGPTPLEAMPVCRYCRTPSMPGERICSRCGMRLPVAGGRPSVVAAAPRLCGCGAPVSGARCPSCGARTSTA